ncbi:MAG: hypothetical protein ACP5OG_05915 [Candidatus Nanoarchaeia archaeon]
MNLSEMVMYSSLVCKSKRSDGKFFSYCLEKRGEEGITSYDDLDSIAKAIAKMGSVGFTSIKGKFIKAYGERVYIFEELSDQEFLNLASMIQGYKEEFKSAENKDVQKTRNPQEV